MVGLPVGVLDGSDDVTCGSRLAVASMVVVVAVGAFLPQADSSIRMRGYRWMGLDPVFIGAVVDLISP